MLFERNELLTKSTLQLEDAEPKSYVDYGSARPDGRVREQLIPQLLFCGRHGTEPGSSQDTRILEDLPGDADPIC